MKNLPVFLCSYYKSYRFGGFDEINAICFANTQQEALGIIITQYPETDTDKWNIMEQYSEVLAVSEISTMSN